MNVQTNDIDKLTIERGNRGAIDEQIDELTIWQLYSSIAYRR